MPQASDDLCDLMFLMFGDGIGDAAPTEFLRSRGYVLTSYWTWQTPSEDHWLTEKEELCIRFLHDEWDYGLLEDWTLEDGDAAPLP